MIFHDSQNLYYRSPIGAVPTQSFVRLAIDVDLKDKVSLVRLHTWQETCGSIYYNLKKSSWDEKHYFIDLDMPEDGCLVWYYFIIELADGKLLYYGNNKAQMGGIGQEALEVPPSYQITVFKKDVKTPDWFKKAVMYQIFPDRFYRSGNNIPQKKHAVLHCDWNEPPMYYLDPDTKNVITYDYFGGNIQGIKEKLSYLKDLGIKAVGVDMLNVDKTCVEGEQYTENSTSAHNVFLGNDILIVENLINLEKLNTTGSTVMFLPLKIKDGDGSPVRAVAFV